MVSNPFEEPVILEAQTDTGGFTQGVDEMITQLGTLRTAIAGAGGALAALSGVALTEATSAAASFEEAMVEVEKVTSEGVAEEMEEDIMAMSQEMPAAQEQLAEVAAAGGRLGVRGEDLEEFTRVATEMGVSTDIAAEQAADSFARLANLMDRDISNSRELGAAINELSNNMGASASEITDVITRAGASLNQLGVADEDILALAGAMNEVSPSSRRAAGSLRRVGNRLLDPGVIEDLSGALNMTSEEFQTMVDESPVEAIGLLSNRLAEGGEAASELRGVMTKRMASDLARLGQNFEAVGEASGMASEELENAGSLSEEYEAATDTLNAKIRIFKNRLRAIGIEIGQQLIPHLTRLVEWLNESLTWFEQLNERTDGMAGLMALLGGIVGGLTIAIAALAPAVGGLTGVATAATSALSGLGTALSILGGPVTIAAAAIAAFALAYHQNLGGIQDATDRFVGNVIDEFHRFIDLMGPVLEEFMGNLEEIWTERLEPMVTSFAEFVAGVGNEASTVENSIVPDLVDALDFLLNDAIISGINEALDAWDELWGSFGGQAAGELTELGNEAAGFSDEFVRNMQLARDMYVAWARMVIRHTRRVRQRLLPIFQGIAQTMLWLWETHLQDLVIEVIDTYLAVQRQFIRLQQTVIPIIEGMLTFILNNVIDPMLNRVTQVWQTHFRDLANEVAETGRVVGDRISQMMDVIMPVIRDGLDLIMSWWDTHGDDVTRIVRNLFEIVADITAFFTDTVLTQIRVFLALIRGDWDEALTIIEQWWGRTWDRVERIFGNIKENVILQMETLVETLFDIFLDLWQRLVGSSIVVDIKNDIIGVFGDLASLAEDAFNNVKDRVLDVMSDLRSQAMSAAQDIADGIVSSITGAVENARDQVDGGGGGGSDAGPPEEGGTEGGDLRLSNTEDTGGEPVDPDGAYNAAEDPDTVATRLVGRAARGETFEPESDEDAVDRFQDTLRDIRGLASGGMIQSSGLAILHAGERVVPAAQVSDRGEMARDADAPSASQIDRLAEEMQRVRRAIESQNMSVELDGEQLSRGIREAEDRYNTPRQVNR